MAAEVSSFEDCQHTLQHSDHDSARVVFGVEVILGAFVCGTKRPLKELHVLDAGCGSGSYTIALSEYVGKVTGVEVNEGILRRAMEKTATLKNVSLTQGDITKMPFPDDHFDAICCNLVIHHLDASGVNDFPKTRKFISEAYRVLKPGGGTLVINTISPEQCTSPWYFSILPKAHKVLPKKMPKISVLQEFLSEAGFGLGSVMVLPDLLFKPEHWYDKEMPFRKHWRTTVNFFDLATDEELEESLRGWREKIDAGTADQFMEECERRRRKIGLTTSVVAHKQ